MAAALLIGLVVLALLAGVMAYTEERHSEYFHSLIGEKEIELVDIRLVPSLGGAYSIKGRVRNKSSHPLAGITLKVQLTDRFTGDLVGERISTFFISVPEGQARDIDSWITFDSLHTPPAQLTFSYQLVGTRAAE